MSKPKPPYLGAAYYPEMWTLPQILQDIDLMKQAGINMVRMGEFAWSTMEPREGVYDFQWLIDVLNMLNEADIAVVLGTPTATPPKWLTAKFPETVAVNDYGMRLQHGSRRHFCPNNSVYRRYSGIIVKKMAETFVGHENIIGWQIDNEVYPSKVLGASDRGCFCEQCQQKFCDYLKNKYINIHNLNEAWGNRLWSMDYPSFDLIEAPRSDTWHSPSLLLHWMLFQVQSNVEYVEFQADILKDFVTQPVGTDMITEGGIGRLHMNDKLDVVQQNHYPATNDLWNEVFWFDLARPIKSRPFWITETATCWNGNIFIEGGYRNKGFCRINSWLAYASGAEMNAFWLWRSHYAAHEMMHSSVITSCGRPMHVFEEIQDISQSLRFCADFLNTTRPQPSAIALHFSEFAWWNFKFQPMLKGFDYFRTLVDSFYKPLVQNGFTCDIVEPFHQPHDYEVIFTPFMPTLDENNIFVDNITNWVKQGGTWIVGPLSDIRTAEGTKYTHSPFGHLEELTGVFCKYQLPEYPLRFSSVWYDGENCDSRIWYDGFEVSSDQAIAQYTEGPLEGLAAIVTCPLGKGSIILLGTTLSSQDMSKLLDTLAQDVPLTQSLPHSTNIYAVTRCGDILTGVIVMELEGREGWCEINHVGRDIITGRTCQGRMSVNPYEVLCIQYTRSGITEVNMERKSKSKSKSIFQGGE